MNDAPSEEGVYGEGNERAAGIAYVWTSAIHYINAVAL
jgi:hypothetical protein